MRQKLFTLALTAGFLLVTVDAKEEFTDSDVVCDFERPCDWQFMSDENVTPRSKFSVVIGKKDAKSSRI